VAIRTLFPTSLYEGEIAAPALIAELAHSCRSLARDDAAGRRWCREHNYPGYTSYGSLTDLPQRDPAFADLVRHLDRHVAGFAAALAFDLPRRLKLDNLWVNILKPRGSHSGHIHPHSSISGTAYIEVPEGAAALKLEDPRLPMLMFAPPRRADAPEMARNFVYAVPRPGTVFLWESWLRHEVPAAPARGERISISFNYR